MKDIGQHLLGLAQPTISLKKHEQVVRAIKHQQIKKM